MTCFQFVARLLATRYWYQGYRREVGECGNCVVSETGPDIAGIADVESDRIATGLARKGLHLRPGTIGAVKFYPEYQQVL